jgi:AraC-like DNA-binding protein
MTTRANRLTPRAKTNGPVAGVDTAPAGHLRAYVDAIDRLGYDVTALLERAGLRRADLDDPDAAIPYTAFEGVICGALAMRHFPNFGAHLAAVTPLGAWQLLDYLVATTDTVRGALEQLVRYAHIVNAPMTLRLAHEGDAVRLLVEPGTDCFMVQYETSIVLHHLRSETGGRLSAHYVSLMDQPEDRTDLERLFGCPVRAPATWSGIEFPNESLRLPLRRRDPVLRRVLESQADTTAPSVGDRSTIARVRTALASRLARVPAIDVIARQLAMAPRTLQRRLAEEGVTYQELVATSRREAAERLLSNATLAVGEIGYLLGFSEPSAFHRAFKRWHDVTPQEYRRVHQRP